MSFNILFCPNFPKYLSVLQTKASILSLIQTIPLFQNCTLIAGPTHQLVHCCVWTHFPEISMQHLTQEIRSQNLSLAAPHSFIPSFVHSFIHVLIQLYIYSVCPRVIFKVETPEVSNWLDIGRDKREAFTNLVLIKTLPSKFLLPGIQTTSFVPLLPLTPLNKMYLRKGIPLSWASYIYPLHSQPCLSCCLGKAAPTMANLTLKFNWKRNLLKVDNLLFTI